MGCYKETPVTSAVKYFTKTTLEESLALSDMINHSVDSGGRQDHGLSCELSDPATKGEAEQSAMEGKLSTPFLLQS
jgi:hypothetical protein